VKVRILSTHEQWRLNTGEDVESVEGEEEAEDRKSGDGGVVHQCCKATARSIPDIELHRS
jgi:hypothetical protein